MNVRKLDTKGVRKCWSMLRCHHVETMLTQRGFSAPDRIRDSGNHPLKPRYSPFPETPTSLDCKEYALNHVRDPTTFLKQGIWESLGSSLLPTVIGRHESLLCLDAHA